jgi:iron complex outermembrane receptor protein
MDMRKIILTVIAGGQAALLGFSIAAQADDAASLPGRENNSLDEITVTAQKRSQNLQDVPVSITVLDRDSLNKARLGSPGDLVQYVPNLQVQLVVGDDVPIFSLRGISMADFSYNQNAPIAAYVDEVYKGNPSLFGITLYDLERVEVLRGPQGTLYGKNTTGGALNFITREPELGSSDGYVKLGYGNYNRVDTTGAVNIPIGETVAARFAFVTANADGWFKSRSAGVQDKNGVANYSIRGELLWRPQSGLEFLLTAQGSLSNPTNYGVWAQIPPGSPGVGGAPYSGYNYLEPNGTVINVPSNVMPDPRTGLGQRELTSSISQHRDDHARSVAFKVFWDLNDSLKLTSITSYDRGDLFDPEDSTGSYVQAARGIYVVAARQFAQDLRLATRFSGPFNILVGTYYSEEQVKNSTDYQLYYDIDYNRDGVLNYLDCQQSIAASRVNPAITPLGCGYQNSFDQTKRSGSVYGDATYDIQSNVQLHAGVRETYDDGRQYNFKSLAHGSDGVPVASQIPGGTDLNATLAQSFQTTRTTGRLGLDYKVSPDNLLYANYSRGYRGASFNAQAFFQVAEFNTAKPEDVEAFEIGTKNQLLDHKLTINGAVFQDNYKNQQVLDVNPSTGAQTLNNLTRSRIRGGELEVTARPLRDLRFNVGVGYTEARVLEGSYIGVDIKGRTLINVPKWTMTGGVDWRAISNDAGHVDAHLDGSYASTQYFSIYNTPAVTQPGYGLLNARLAYAPASDKYEIALWVKNLTDKLYSTFIGDNSGSFGEITHELGTPRTYGIEASYRF